MTSGREPYAKDPRVDAYLAPLPDWHGVAES